MKRRETHQLAAVTDLNSPQERALGRKMSPPRQQPRRRHERQPARRRKRIPLRVETLQRVQLEYQLGIEQRAMLVTRMAEGCQTLIRPVPGSTATAPMAAAARASG